MSVLLTGLAGRVWAGMGVAILQDAVDLDSAHDDLAAVVRQALEPAHVSVWIRPPA